MRNIFWNEFKLQHCKNAVAIGMHIFECVCVCGHVMRKMINMTETQVVICTRTTTREYDHRNASNAAWISSNDSNWNRYNYNQKQPFDHNLYYYFTPSGLVWVFGKFWLPSSKYVTFLKNLLESRLESVIRTANRWGSQFWRRTHRKEKKLTGEMKMEATVRENDSC